MSVKCYNPGTYSLSSAASQQRLPCSNGCSLVFWTDTNQTLQFISTHSPRKALLCTWKHKDKWIVHSCIYTTFNEPKPVLAIKKQDFSGWDNWCAPAVQSTGQEICDTSENRLRRLPHFVHSECSAGCLSTAWFGYSAPVRDSLWLQHAPETRSGTAGCSTRWWPFITSSHKHRENLSLCP